MATDPNKRQSNDGPIPSPAHVKVRIAVVVNERGEWQCAGWSTRDGILSDADAVDHVKDCFGYPEWPNLVENAHFIEAWVPVPQPLEPLTIECEPLTMCPDRVSPLLKRLGVVLPSAKSLVEQSDFDDKDVVLDELSECIEAVEAWSTVETQGGE